MALPEAYELVVAPLLGNSTKVTVAAGKVSPEALSLMVPETVNVFFDCAGNKPGNKSNSKIIRCFAFNIIIV